MYLDSFTTERKELRDPRTRRTVWQVTDGEFECVAPYMDKIAWTRDDRFLVFNCNRTGYWQPYRLELETGEAVQICEVDCGAFRSVALTLTGEDAFCADGPLLRTANIYNFAHRVAINWNFVLNAPATEGKAGADAVVLNRDGSKAVQAYLGRDGYPWILIVLTDGTNEFETFRVPNHDVTPGHILFCPTDDRILSFHGYPDRQNNPNARPEHRAAQWRLDVRTMEMTPLVHVEAGYRATHCLWGLSGERFYFHLKKVPTWTPTALCSVDAQGQDLRVHYGTTEHKLGHSCPSPGEKWIVTDSQDVPENILMLCNAERDEQDMLCWPNASIKRERPHKRRPDLPPHTDTDTHPGFSLTGRYVHYTSDVSGRSQIYVVPVDDIVKPGE